MDTDNRKTLVVGDDVIARSGDGQDRYETGDRLRVTRFDLQGYPVLSANGHVGLRPVYSADRLIWDNKVNAWVQI